MRKNRPWIVTALLALGLTAAGCGGTVVNYTNFDPAYSRSLVTSAIDDGTLAFFVHGAATPSLDQAQTTQAITDGVRPPTWLANTRLVPRQDTSGRRLVFIFNAQSVAAAANRGCGPLQDIATGSGSGGRIVVAGAFCDGGDAISSTSGSIAANTDAGQATVQLVQQMTLALLPLQHPDRRRDRLRFDAGP